MLKSLTSKVFVGLIAVSLLQVAFLTWAFSRLLISESESNLFDTLSLRMQASVAIGSNQLKSEKDLEDWAKSQRLTVIRPDGEVLGYQRETFSKQKLEKIIPSERTSNVVTICKDVYEERHLCALGYLSGFNVWLLEAVPQSTSFQIFRKLAKEILIIAFSVLAIAIFLSLIFSFGILRPLRLFSRAVDKISRGDFQNIELPFQRQDEIGQLSQAFQKMSEDLQDRERNLGLQGIKLAHSERLASIGQMGASVAHEIKNPLTSMLGYAKVLAQRVQEPQLKEAAEIIAKESERCSLILNQLLKFSRSESQEPRIYSLSEVLESSLMLVQAEAKKVHIQIESSIEITQPLKGQPTEVQQILLNLLMNALHASARVKAEKSEASKIVVTANQTPAHAIVKITDYAQGIPEDLRARVFDPFFTTKERGEGTGLGLSVAADLARQQGGTLAFDSKEGRGTTFVLVLPFPSETMPT